MCWLSWSWLGKQVAEVGCFLPSLTGHLERLCSTGLLPLLVAPRYDALGTLTKTGCLLLVLVTFLHGGEPETPLVGPCTDVTFSRWPSWCLNQVSQRVRQVSLWRRPRLIKNSSAAKLPSHSKSLKSSPVVCQSLDYHGCLAHGGSQHALIAPQRAMLAFSPHHLLTESSKLYILLFLESKEPLIVIEMFDTASLKYFTTKLYLCLSQDLGMGTGS